MGLSAVRAPRPAARLCSLLQTALSPSSSTTSRCVLLVLLVPEGSPTPPLHARAHNLGAVQKGSAQLCTVPSLMFCSISAPSHAPKLHLKSIGKSQAELSWEPVAVELRNGFITHYTVFWANSTAEVSSESWPCSMPPPRCCGGCQQPLPQPDLEVPEAFLLGL